MKTKKTKVTYPFYVIGIDRKYLTKPTRSIVGCRNLKEANSAKIYLGEFKWFGEKPKCKYVRTITTPPKSSSKYKDEYYHYTGGWLRSGQ